MESQSVDVLEIKKMPPRSEGKKTVNEFAEKKKIKSIFNKNTVIEKTENGFRIETELLDGIEEGEQSIEIKTSRPKKVDKLNIDVDVLEILELKINGVDVIDFFDNVYLEMRPFLLRKGETFSFLELQLYKQYHPLHIAALHGTGSMAVKKKDIFLTSFKDADDLIKLFHEQGHCDDKDKLTPEQVDQIGYFGTIYNKELKENVDRDKAVKGWEQVVLMEIRANMNALSKIVEISKMISIFPKDETTGFFRFRKAREIALITYANMSNGWYKDQVSSEKIQELFSM